MAKETVKKAGAAGNTNKAVVFIKENMGIKIGRASCRERVYREV